MKTKDILILGGIAVAGWFILSRRSAPSPSADIIPGVGGALMSGLGNLPGFAQIKGATEFAGGASSAAGQVVGGAQRIVEQAASTAGIIAGYAGMLKYQGDVSKPGTMPILQNTGVILSEAAKGSYAIGSAPGGGFLFTSGKVSGSGLAKSVPASVALPVAKQQVSGPISSSGLAMSIPGVPSAFPVKSVTPSPAPSSSSTSSSSRWPGAVNTPYR